MFPKTPMSTLAPVPGKQCGLGLPATVFLISIIAALVAALANLSESGAAAFGQDYQSMRAFYAAESGANVGLNRVIVGGESNCATLASIDFDSGGANAGLDDCVATLACSSVTVDGSDYLTISSTATCGSGFEQAARAVEVRARLN